MISYNILHFNRPYLLELTVKSMRKFCPDIQIIVADDGSDSPVIKRIKKMPIDDLFVTKHIAMANKNVGSCSNAILGALNLSKEKYYMFGEDDFLYVAQFIPFNIAPVTILHQGDATPRIYFDKLIGYEPLNESIAFLEDPRIKLIQLSRFKSIMPEGIKEWLRIEIKKDVYNNHPFIMRTEEIKELEIPEDISIYRFQRVMEEQILQKFSGYDCIRSGTACFVHAGLHLSFNIKTKERIKNFEIFWVNFSKVCKQDLKHTDAMNNFYKKLLHLYLRNKFIIDFDQMLEEGLNEACLSAILKCKKYL